MALGQPRTCVYGCHNGFPWAVQFPQSTAQTPARTIVTFEISQIHLNETSLETIFDFTNYVINMHIDNCSNANNTHLAITPPTQHGQTMIVLQISTVLKKGKKNNQEKVLPAPALIFRQIYTTRHPRESDPLSTSSLATDQGWRSSNVRSSQVDCIGRGPS